METAIRKFIDKNRRPNGYQVAAFAYEEECLKGGIKRLKNGRVFIGQWEITPLSKKGYYIAFICKSFSDGNYFENHSLRLKIKQNKNGTCEVVSDMPIKGWGFNKNK